MYVVCLEATRGLRSRVAVRCCISQFRTNSQSQVHEEVSFSIAAVPSPEKPCLRTPPARPPARPPAKHSSTKKTSLVSKKAKQRFTTPAGWLLLSLCSVY